MENIIINFEKIRRVLGHKAITTKHFDFTEDGLVNYSRAVLGAYQAQVEVDTAENGGRPMPVRPAVPAVNIMDLSITHTTCSGNTRLRATSTGIEYNFDQTDDQPESDRAIRQALIRFYAESNEGQKLIFAEQALFGLEAHPSSYVPKEWDEAYDDVYSYLDEHGFGEWIANTIENAEHFRADSN